ncbi:MAG: hypothetical protein Q8P26_04295 [Candidatus Levybacteria bacterium]|nr:hypothetical protein [Candidatus Levybacteria bacterium]
MSSDRKLLIAFLFTTLILLLRDAPYLNVLILNKLWIAYILLIAVIAFFFIPRNVIYLKGTLLVLPFVALVFGLIGVPIGAEVVGIILYSVLWFAAVLRLISFMREKDDRNK